MRVYFYSQNINKQADNIILLFKKKGLKLSSNLFLNNKSDLFSDRNLNQADSFIFFVKSLDKEITYIMALALSRRKRVFFLLPKNTKLDNSFKFLQKDIKTYFYNENDLYNQAASIINGFGIKNKKSIFNIKYTLRLSEKISDYLNWKASNVNMSGADWLRQLIQENMDNDTDYQAVLKNKYKLN